MLLVITHLWKLTEPARRKRGVAWSFAWRQVRYVTHCMAMHECDLFFFAKQLSTPEMCRSWDRELISGRSSFSFPISFWTKNVSGCTRERDERIGNFIWTVPRSLNRNLLTNAAKYCWTMMVCCVSAVDELPSAIASTAQSSYPVNSGIFKMLTTRRRFAVMAWTHTPKLS